MGHARCDRAVRLLHQASSFDRAGAGSCGWTSPVQDTHAGQSFSGSHPPPPVPARDHHRTTGSLTVILALSEPHDRRALVIRQRKDRDGLQVQVYAAATPSPAASARRPACTSALAAAELVCPFFTGRRSSELTSLPSLS